MVNLSFVVTAAYHGTGQHADMLPPAELVEGLKVRHIQGLYMYVT